MIIHWVATDGNDSTGNGSYDSPYKTIEYALTLFSTGDQVRLKDGVYSPIDSIVLNGLDGSIFSENPGGATIQPLKTEAHQACIAILNSTRFTIQGINILQAADTTGNLIGIYADVENFICFTCDVNSFSATSGTCVGIFASGSLGRIENCTVSNFACAGTALYGIQSNGLDVIDCEVSVLSGAGNCLVWPIDVDGLTA